MGPSERNRVSYRQSGPSLSRIAAPVRTFIVDAGIGGLSDEDSKMLRPSLREMTDAPTRTPCAERRFIRIRSASASDAGGGAGRCGARARGARRVAAKEGVGDGAEAR